MIASGDAVAKLAQALASRSGMQPAQQVGDGVRYETHPTADAANARLQELQGQGRQGFVQPIGPQGIYGHEVRHWPMQ